MVTMRPKYLPYLSKSKFIEGMKCLKLLWYEYHRKDEIPKFDILRRSVMDMGTKVGELARTLFPDGVKLERMRVPADHAAQSREALSLRKPLFEAGFIYKRVYALADILVPAGADEWDLVEVKSSTGVKEYHKWDLAFQKYTYEGAGLNIRKCYIMHINNRYVKNGDIVPRDLFSKKEVTEEVDELIPDVVKKISGMVRIVDSNNMPDVKIGQYCRTPYPCVLEGICWDFLPEKDHVFLLHGRKKIAFDLMEQGILKMEDIPEGCKLTGIQDIQVKSHKNQEPHVDKAGVRKFIDKLKYPLHFLDFETIAPAVPVYDLTRPFENVPFQYSLYIVEKDGARPRHHSYLAPERNDPRPEILKQLERFLGDSGSILAYNASFEIQTLHAAIIANSQYGGWFRKIKERFVDLHEPFRQFSYYHPRQKGSGSIKDVLPAMTGSGYEGMEIAEGGIASYEYYRVTFGDSVDEDERRRVRLALEKYCDLDTKGMIGILYALMKDCYCK